MKHECFFIWPIKDPALRVQCAVAGLVENPEQFIKPAQKSVFLIKT